MFPTASAHGTLLGSLAQSANGDSGDIKLPPTVSFNLTQLALLGHAGSLGRTRLNDGVAAPAASRARGSVCRTIIAAIPLSTLRLRISHLLTSRRRLLISGGRRARDRACLCPPNARVLPNSPIRGKGEVTARAGLVISGGGSG